MRSFRNRIIIGTIVRSATPGVVNPDMLCMTGLDRVRGEAENISFKIFSSVFPYSTLEAFVLTGDGKKMNATAVQMVS